MNTTILKCITAACMLGTLAGCSNLISASREEPIREDQGSRTIGAYVEDEVIENKTLVNLNKGSETVKNSHISVTSYNGILLLTGQVPNESAKQEAEQITMQTRKVRKIHNELEISGPTSSIVRGNDAYLTSRIKLQLLTDETVEGSRIKVVTENSSTYLMGLVTEKEADRAVNIIRTIPGVQRIVKVFEYIPRR
ncbi:BON domain-containing protein [Neptunomonas antarctica]|uniref:Osmotically-inducible protein OsmY, contains BON domain n=1 Tax=Neptunomonas antarctica TaxID=619304 RepID=A0A1N7PFJ8_9GAMM|nr:BON domain-containing protein [Neptunomonas antarctica]SIT09300.1 Osmotically-inducible protein OsmY, contains BON domain [Neptunomonas antarctica]